MPNPNDGLHAASAATTNLENGEICLNSLQCASKVCLHDTVSGLAYCTAKGPEGSRCLSTSISGIFYVPACARGLICLKQNEDDNYGICLDGDIDASDVIKSITVTGGRIKTEYTRNGVTQYVYACETGYYGTPTESTGCKPCPEQGLCPMGDNADFFCASGYYHNGAQCSRCPSVQDTSGNTVYGLTTGPTFNRGGGDICRLQAGTYTDANGTFELSDECAYVP